MSEVTRPSRIPPSGDLVALGVEDRVVGHQVADVAHEQQRPSVEVETAAVGSGVLAVAVEHPGEGLATLGDLFGEIALVQAQPVAVAGDLVLGVDRGDRVLEVHDRGDRGLDDDVLDAGRVGGTDRRGRVDLDVEVKAVVAQQDRGRRPGFAAVADECGRVGQRRGATTVEGHLQGTVHDGEGPHVGVAALLERNGLVQEVLRVGDDLVTADLVVRRTLLGAVGLRDRVGAVEGVVERSPPAGVGAFSAKRALRTGTTSCGPAVSAISRSTLPVVIWKSAGTSVR